MTETSHPYQIGADGRYVMNSHPAAVERLQKQRRQEHARAIAAAIAAREAEEAEQTAERERAVREAGQQRLEDYRGRVHQQFLHNGATERDFEAAWPSLREEWLKQQLGDGVAADVARLRQHPNYSV